MQDEREINNLPPIPEEMSSYHSSFFCDPNSLPDGRTIPIYTPSSSLLFDQEREINSRQISQSPIFVRGNPQLSPMIESGLFDLKPVVPEHAAQEGCTPDDVVIEGSNELNMALSLEQSAQIEKEEQELAKKEKEVKEIMAMQITQLDEALMRESGVDENQSPMEIIEFLRKKKPAGIGFNFKQLGKIMALFFALLILLKFYLKVEDLGFTSLPINSDRCSIQGEWLISQSDVRFKERLEITKDLYQTQEQQSYLHQGDKVIELSELDQEEILNLEGENPIIEELENEGMTDVPHGEAEQDLKTQGTELSNVVEEKNEEFEQVEWGQGEESSLQMEPRERGHELKKQTVGMNCEGSFQDFMIERIDQKILIPRACLSLLKPNQFI